MRNHIRCTNWVIHTPFLHKVLTLENDERGDICAIGTNCHQSCDILVTCSSLLLMALLSPPTNNTLRSSGRRRESGLIHSIDQLWWYFFPRLVYIWIYNFVKPVVNGSRVDTLSTRLVKWITPKRLQSFPMPLNNRSAQDLPTRSA